MKCNNTFVLNVYTKLQVASHTTIPAHSTIGSIHESHFGYIAAHPNYRIVSLIVVAELASDNTLDVSERTRFSDALIEELPRIRSVSLCYGVNFFLAYEVWEPWLSIL